MEKYFAGFFSVVFQPLLIPTYAFLIFIYSNLFFETGVIAPNYLYLLMPFSILTFLMPVIFLLYFRYRKIISSLYLKNRKERNLPYIITFVFYFAAYYSLRSLDIPSVVLFFTLGSTLLIAVALIVNIWWKISAHMIALGGLTGMLLAITFFAQLDLSPYILFAVVISGLTAYARLYEKAHSAPQVYVGYLTGIVVMLGLFYVTNL